MHKSKLLAALVIGLSFSLPAAAKMYKWVDDQGVTHYGETIPPEYANKDRSELNKSGRVIKKEEVLTPEERRDKEQEAVKKREEAAAALEQKRRDKALLNTYSNEKEIDLARNRNMQQVDARINSVASQVKMASDNLLGHQNEADNLTRANRKIPKDLQEELQEAKARLDKAQQDLDKAKAEKVAIEARYDADKARYKELTGR